MTKIRVNMRIRPELWEAVQRAVGTHGKDQTAVVERALERLLKPQERNGSGSKRNR